MTHCGLSQHKPRPQSNRRVSCLALWIKASACCSVSPTLSGSMSPFAMISPTMSSMPLSPVTSRSTSLQQHATCAQTREENRVPYRLQKTTTSLVPKEGKFSNSVIFHPAQNLILLRSNVLLCVTPSPGHCNRHWFSFHWHFCPQRNI